MRVFGPAAFVCLLGFVFVGCATGTAADDSTTIDSGNKTDSSTKNDSGTKPDTGTVKDTGTPPPDTGTGNCGGQCLGLASTCCNNVCVDITGDGNNCGGCGTSCGSTSCCAGNCVDTMGSDTTNCGACGVTCNGTCVGGTCQTQGGGCTISKGSCSHSPCVAGSALPAGCDANDEDLTDGVCLLFDPTCCTSSWTSSCVLYASFFEANSCQGSGC
jgi:hypothetical protein